MHVRVPGSSANLGPGFDVLGMALGVYTDAWWTDPQHELESAPVEATHPAAVAFAALGGTGDLWVRSTIPMGRGLGYSGSVRVAGAAAAVAQQAGRGVDNVRQAIDRNRAEMLRITTPLEGHPDNVAASVYGGVVAAVDDQAIVVPFNIEAEVVVWIPSFTTSTDQSRRALPDVVRRDDAVFNLGRVATLIAAFASGATDKLAMATQDRLHQPQRFEAAPLSAHAVETATNAGALAAWLSGSGPTVAALCRPADTDTVRNALPVEGHTKVLAVDHQGVHVVGAD